MNLNPVVARENERNLAAGRPLVSVCMAVYNGERYVEEAIGSVLAQTFADFEFVIIDDGSADATPEILDRLAAVDLRLRVIHQENAGLMKSLNRAVSEARGHLVARMDGDDYCEPERFEKQVRFLEENPDVVAVGCRVLMVDPEGRPLRRSLNPLRHEEIDDFLLHGKGWAIQHPAVMMRREALLGIGGYSEEFRFSEDLQLFLRLAEVGRLANLPDVLLRYRQHDQSICHANRPVQKECHDAILAQAYERRGIEPLPAAEFRGTALAAGDQHRIWAWWALKEGYVGTARRHAVATLRRAPLSRATWKLVLCALRGR